MFHLVPHLLKQTVHFVSVRKRSEKVLQNSELTTITNNQNTSFLLVLICIAFEKISAVLFLAIDLISESAKLSCYHALGTRCKILANILSVLIPLLSLHKNTRWYL